MNTTEKIYRAITEFPLETLLSVDVIASNTGLNYYQTESIMRAMAKDRIILLAATCDINETPHVGIFKGNAKVKEYYFMIKNRHVSYEEEIGLRKRLILKK